MPNDPRATLLPPDILPLFNDGFVRSCDLFEEYVFRLTLDVFRRTGLDDAVSRTPATTRELIAKSGLDARIAPVPVDWMLRELASRGVLASAEADGAVRYRLEGTLPDLDPSSILDQQRRHDPAALPSYAMATVASEGYPAVLRGETTGEQILFGPERIGAWSEYFSNENVLYAISNTIGAIACESAFPPAGGAILELGGGLGSGAEALLAHLAACGRAGNVSTYRFTEISIPFLRRGQKTLPLRFPGVSFAFARCDMNRPFSEANVAPGSYALVHGVNTLHVASDLAFTLNEIRAALQPTGRLVISECVRPFPRQPVYVEFVFNLLEAFREPVIHPVFRPNGGFLTPEQWTSGLTSNGFRDVRIVPDIAAIRNVYPSFVVASIVASPA